MLAVGIALVMVGGIAAVMLGVMIWAMRGVAGPKRIHFAGGMSAPKWVPLASVMAGGAGVALLINGGLDAAVIGALMTPFGIGALCVALRGMEILQCDTGASAWSLRKPKAKRVAVRWSARDKNGEEREGVALMPFKKASRWRIAWALGWHGRVIDETEKSGENEDGEWEMLKWSQVNQAVSIRWERIGSQGALQRMRAAGWDQVELTDGERQEGKLGLKKAKEMARALNEKSELGTMEMRSLMSNSKGQAAKRI